MIRDTLLEYFCIKYNSDLTVEIEDEVDEFIDWLRVMAVKKI